MQNVELQANVDLLEIEGLDISEIEEVAVADSVAIPEAGASIGNTYCCSCSSCCCCCA